MKEDLELLGKAKRIEFDCGVVYRGSNGWLAETTTGATIKTIFRTIEDAYRALSTGTLRDL